MRIVLLVGLVLTLGLTACGGGDSADSETASAEKPSARPTPDTPAITEKEVPTEPANPIVARSLAKDPGPSTEVAVIQTNHGEIVVRFFPKQAPLAVSNFKGLAAKGSYDGVTFHRIIPKFMIQGGDPRGTGYGGTSLWGSKFEDEISPSLVFTRPGLLAMANTGRPVTNSSQFFITVAPAEHLNEKHTIFGEVVEGMAVVTAIENVKVDGKGKPVTPVVMESVTIRER